MLIHPLEFTTNVQSEKVAWASRKTEQMQKQRLQMPPQYIAAHGHPTQHGGIEFKREREGEREREREKERDRAPNVKALQVPSPQ